MAKSRKTNIRKKLRYTKEQRELEDIKAKQLAEQFINPTPKRE